MKLLSSKTQPSHRQRRVGMIIRRALSDILFENNSKITISEAVLSRDLRFADIFITPAFELSVQQKQEKITDLKNDIPLLRKKLAQRATLKYVPQLRFHLDQRFEQTQYLDRLSSS